MKIKGIICDICKKEFNYPESLTTHHHPEFDIEGVPINFWSPICKFNSKTGNQLTVHLKNPGIRKFVDYLPSNLRYFKSLGEGNTPLSQCDHLSTKFGFNILLKDESVNPTGSFKDRGMPLLLADAKQSGKKIIGIPSTGNAALSLSTYAQEYKVKPLVFIPDTISKEKEFLIREKSDVIYDKNIIESWNHFFRYCKEHPEIYNGYPTTNIPYQQGIKTITYELFLQLGKKLPDWLVIPCGSGGNIVSQYQACLDLYNLGFISKLPKFVSVQISGADPITIGYNSHQTDKVVVIKNMKESKAEGIASDTCFNYFKIMNILQKTNGLALSISDSEINNFSEYPHLEYTSLSVFAVLNKLKTIINNNETVVLIGTARKNK